MEKTNPRIVKLSQETVDQTEKIDQSIIYWSIEHTKASIAADEARKQVSNLFKFKETEILNDLKSQGIDVKGHEVATLDKSTVVITKKEEQNAATEGQSAGP